MLRPWVVFSVLFLLGEVSKAGGRFSSHWVCESLAAFETESIFRGRARWRDPSRSVPLGQVLLGEEQEGRVVAGSPYEQQQAFERGGSFRLGFGPDPRNLLSCPCLF